MNLNFELSNESEVRIGFTLTAVTISQTWHEAGRPAQTITIPFVDIGKMVTAMTDLYNRFKPYFPKGDS